MVHDRLECSGFWETFRLVSICFPLVTPFIHGTSNPLFGQRWYKKYEHILSARTYADFTAPRFLIFPQDCEWGDPHSTSQVEASGAYLSINLSSLVTSLKLEASFNP
jgi:hypothetical protein